MGCGAEICRPAGPGPAVVRWKPGGGAALQPLQGAGGAIAVPRTDSVRWSSNLQGIS